jgi:hypothetical protein
MAGQAGKRATALSWSVVLDTFATSLAALSIEHLFVGSLLAGFILSLLLVASVARIPLRIRFKSRPRLKLKKGKVHDDQPRFLPALVGASITCFGLFGLILRVLLNAPATAALGGALSASLLLFAWLQTVTRKLVDSTGKPMEGASVVGSVAHVCLSIPGEGVGAIAYYSEGKRHTMPACSAVPLELGTKVVVLDLKRRVAVVEALDLWGSSIEECL